MNAADDADKSRHRAPLAPRAHPFGARGRPRRLKGLGRASGTHIIPPGQWLLTAVLHRQSPTPKPRSPPTIIRQDVCVRLRGRSAPTPGMSWKLWRKAGSLARTDAVTERPWRSGHPTHDDGGVRAAEAERVRQHRVDLALLRRQRHEIDSRFD